MTDAIWSNSAYASIVRTFSARTGLVFRGHQRDNTEQAIRQAMAQCEITDLAAMARMVEHDERVLDCLIVELTVGETYFLREPTQCDFIRQRVLPDVLQRKGADHRIRIWSAGSASGEEPYSLAMMCTAMGLDSRVSILGTDISSVALKKARTASYRPWSLRGSGAEFARSYLHFDGQHYRVNEEIRRMVHFEFLNLALDVYPSLVTGTQSMDLILCRNVMIYFNRETTRTVAERLYQCLSDGGWLITASGDPPLDGDAPFETVVTDGGVYYRKPVRASGCESADCRVDRPEKNCASDATTRRRAVSPRLQPHPSVSTTATARRPIHVGDAAGLHRDRLALAATALAAGQYRRTAELTETCLDNAKACVMHINALANIDTQRAREECGKLAERHALSAEIHYLHAVLCLERNQLSDAARSAERAVYVDRSLPTAHFLLGSILLRLGEFAAARREFRNAKNLCSQTDPDSVLPLSDGETARQLAEAADVQLVAIDAAMGR